MVSRFSKRFPHEIEAQIKTWNNHFSESWKSRDGKRIGKSIIQASQNKIIRNEEIS
jgi:hypothetical protein